MRRADRKITHAEVMSILEKGEYGVLSLCSNEHVSYGVPLNYCLVDNRLYFHCAMEGLKQDLIVQNPNVSFCVVGETQLLPDKFATNYESVIVSGKAAEAFGEEKRAALEGLVAKYSSAYMTEGHEYIAKLLEKTRVFGISQDEVTGKARK